MLPKLQYILGNKTCRRHLSLMLGLLWLLLWLADQSMAFDLAFIGKIATCLLCFVCALLIIRSLLAANIIYGMVFIYMALYIQPIVDFYFYKIYFSAYSTTDTFESANKMVLVFLLYLLVLNYVLKVRPDKAVRRLKFRSSGIIFWGLFCGIIGLMIYFRPQGNIYAGEDGSLSTAFEYLLTLMVPLYVYTNGERVKLLMFYLSVILYAFLLLLAGGRMAIIMIGLLVCIVSLQYVYSFKKILFMLLIGIVLMDAIGRVRSNPSIILSGDFKELYSAQEKVFQGNNQGDVLWASERMFVLMQNGELTTNERISSGMSFLYSPFMPGAMLPPLANLSSYKKDVVGTGGGGLAPIFIYSMYGLVGVIFLAIFIGRVLNLLCDSRVVCWKFVYALYVVVTLPRWFAYYPIQLIKLCVIAPLIFMFIEYIARNIRMKKQTALNHICKPS